jgi:hypothetical protein
MYIEGWEELDASKLVAAGAKEFVFDDPMESGPVTKDGLSEYMRRWDARVKAAGRSGIFEISDYMEKDDGGVLICWEWWRCVGTPFEGAAVVKTSDDGVFSERIVYR